MTKLAITAVSIALLSASGFSSGFLGSGVAHAAAHEDPQAQIEKLQQDKKILATRLRNAIAVSKQRAAELQTAGETKDHMSTGITSAIAQSKKKAAQMRMLQQQLESEQSKSKALASRLRNAIAVSKDRGAHLESEQSKRKALANRLRNAIAVSKDRGTHLESEQSKRKVLANRLRNAIAVSKERGAHLESEQSKRKTLANRLRNAIAVSKERGTDLASEKSKNKMLSNRLRNAIAYSKERAMKTDSMQAQSTEQKSESDWAASVSATLDAAIGGVEGTSVISKPDNSVNVQVGNNGLFSTGGIGLSGDGARLLATIAQELSAIDGNITVVGHTDNIPVGNSNRFSSNEELSFARAVSTLEFLRGQGIPTERLSAAGYGAGSPIADNNTAEGRQQNRRVDIMLRQQ